MNPLIKKIRFICRKSYWPHEKFIRREYNRALYKTFYFVNDDKIAGDYLEFGVYRGDSLREAIDCANRFKISGMEFWGFDSFKGCPEETEELVPSQFEVGSFSSTIQRTKKLFSRKELRSNVNLIEGYFSDTLSDPTLQKMKANKAAIINIDCDLYSSTLDVLNFVTPLLQTGTVIFFDDWFCHKGAGDHGEQRAFNQWYAQHQERFVFRPFLRYGVHGQVFVCEVLQ